MAEMSDETWQDMIDINLTGVFKTIRAALPHLSAGASIVLTGSIASAKGLPNNTHYTAAKHGLVGIMRALANEVAPQGIRVNCVNPTNVDTPLLFNDAIYKLFRPDLEAPGKDDVVDIMKGMHALDTGWVRARRRQQRRAVPRLGGGPLHHRGRPAGRRGRAHPLTRLRPRVRPAPPAPAWSGARNSVRQVELDVPLGEPPGAVGLLDQLVLVQGGRQQRGLAVLDRDQRQVGVDRWPRRRSPCGPPGWWSRGGAGRSGWRGCRSSAS